VPSALYNRDILRLAASIPHQGRLSAPQASADKSSPVCGSRVTVDVALDGNGRISALGQEVNACALGQASAALFGAHALGTTAAEIAAARDSLSAYLKRESEEPGTWPGLSVLGVARPFAARHASILLPFEAAAEAAAQAGRADAA
jgi:NifU-like protein involved in Fe-S cluster formation